MIDLKKIKMPSAVEVDGIFYEIKTDFRYWLGFVEMCKDEEATFTDFDFLYLDKKPANRILGFTALQKFCYPKRELPRISDEGNTDNVRLFDYRIDGDLIFSAFMQQYHIDLTEVSMHWYKFTALFDSLENTRFNDVMNFRSYRPKNGKRSDYDKYMLKMRNQWRLEETYTKEEQEAIERFERLAGK